jgi:hypothetical protein
VQINITAIAKRKETIKQDGCRLLLDEFPFVGISRITRFSNNSGLIKLSSN